MRKYLLVAVGAALLAGSGVAFAQMPPPDGPHDGMRGGEHREGYMMHRWHPRDENAAFFRFRRGDAEMDIKCPGNEQVQACVAAAGTLMDKVAAMNGPKAQ